MFPTLESFLAIARVHRAILNTREANSEYWQYYLKQKINGESQGCYPQYNTIEKLEMDLLKARWSLVEEKIFQEKIEFLFKTTDIPGLRGLINIKNVSENEIFMLYQCDNKRTFSLLIDGVKREVVGDTYLVISQEKGPEMVKVFGPGFPVEPTVIHNELLKSGDYLNKKGALDFGFKWALLAGKNK